MNRLSKSKRRLALRLKSPRGRESAGLALAEGPRVVMEALASPVEVRWVACGGEFAAGESGRAIADAAGRRGCETLIADGAVVRELCATESPQPVVACVRPPPLGEQSLERGRYLLARGVRIPGNLGTLIRSAWGFGLDGVVIGAETVDPWNPKVVRASAGAVFHVPLLAAPHEAEGAATAAAGTRRGGPLNLLHADAAGRPVHDVAEASRPNWVLVVGNETAGVAPPPGERARRISVPLAEGVDSLNVGVAGSILMYLLTHGGVGKGEAHAPSRGPDAPPDAEPDAPPGADPEDVG